MGGCLHQAVIISDDDELNSSPAWEQCTEAKWCFLKENSKTLGLLGIKNLMLFSTVVLISLIWFTN